MSAATSLICPRCEHRFDIERIPAEWASCPNCGFHETGWQRPEEVEAVSDPYERQDRPDRIEYVNRSAAHDDVERYVLDFRKMTVEKVSPNRQGWRARLANVERLLAEAEAGAMWDALGEPFPTVAQALAEVRSMLDGETDE